MTNILEEKRRAWDVIFCDPNLSVNSLRHRAIAGTVCQNGLRSVCWKVFLGCLPTLEVSTWPSILLEQRQRYTDLKRKYIEEPAEKMNKKGEEDLTDNNPLALNDSNPWQQFFADSEVRKVIRQDVERTFPDVDFFRQDNVQQRLTDILFIYCKLNRDVSYRQGMHELLAPFYWILATESIDNSSMDHDPSDPATKLMTQVLDSAFVEHDAYILFDKLMTHGKSWYEFNDDVSSRKAQTKVKPDILSDNIPKPPDSAKLNPVVMTCHRIHHQYLRTVDPLLYRHLENFGIEPQLYGIRWIRLLFGREFEIYELLKLWDAIFAQDPTLQIVDYICLVILLRMRDQLLQKDYAECLSLLMRPPQINKPASLVEQAKHLQQNLSSDTALQILQQNDVRSGKEPRTSLSDGVVEFPSPQQTNYSRQQLQQRTLHHRSSQGSNLDFSKIMKNPQMRDLNKAIAGVMKNVNTFGENVLGKADGLNSGPRRSTVSSEFPSGIDRVATSYKHERAVPVSAAKVVQDQRSIAKLQSVNQQMGEMMAKCISLLENEIVSPLANKSNASAEQKSVQKEESTAENDSVVADVDVVEGGNNENHEENTVKDPVEYDGSESSVVDEEEEKPATPIQNEATIIMALAGLKHVRDVLLGKQKHFDTSVIDVKLIEQSATPIAIDNNNNEDWDIFDHKEAASNSPPLLQQQANRDSIPETSSSIISNEIDNSYVKNKPLPPLVQQQQQQAQRTPPAPINTSIRVETKLPEVPITYIPANPTPPKQQIKYRIEDLLSDPDLQLTSPKASTNSKFKWMLSNENENQDNTTSGSAGAQQDLFKTDQAPRMSPRKRSSFIIKKAVIDSVGGGENATIDPLDAKNVDNRKAYEYDML